MEGSSINISLTYLRGLEIAELKYEDMPQILKDEDFDKLDVKEYNLNYNK